MGEIRLTGVPEVGSVTKADEVRSAETVEKCSGSHKKQDSSVNESGLLL